MWRESWRRVTVVVVALVAAACTNAEAGSTTTTPSEPTTTTAVETTTTMNPPTITTATEATTATTVDLTETVGSPEALAEEVQEARDLIQLQLGDGAAASIPEPDLTNPDPLLALRELLLFELESIQIGSVQQYADILALRNSPAYGSLRRNLDTFAGAELRIVLLGEYQIHAVESLTEEELEAIAGVEIVAEAPDGSAFVAYETSNGPYDVIRADGSLFQQEAGWERRRRAAILSPTESGWKYYWDESS